MGGWVHAMEPRDFERWLGGGASGAPPAASGAQLFRQLACDTCHRPGESRGPALEGLFGTEVKLAGGDTVVADEGYLRESILDSQARIVAGYEKPVIMPTYQGQVGEEQLLQLIAYIKSIGPGQPAAAVEARNR